MRVQIIHNMATAYQHDPGSYDPAWSPLLKITRFVAINHSVYLFLRLTYHTDEFKPELPSIYPPHS